MASSGFFQMFAFFLAASFIISSISAADLNYALFAFGDGLYDLGNDAYLNPNSQYKLYPYGMDITCATGRPSDGHLVVDFIADKSNLHRRVRAYHANVTAQWHYGVSFATAGATLRSNDTIIDILRQLRDFIHVGRYLFDTYGETQAEELLSNSIYLFTFGTKELLSLGPSVDPATLVAAIDELIEAYTFLIAILYQLGARKFGFQNVGPLREMPYFKNLYGTNNNCLDDYKPVAQWFNTRLEDRLRQLASCEEDGETFEGFQYAYFDYNFVVANLSSSFYNGTDACCGSGEFNGKMTCAIGDYNLCSDPSQYVWFDGVHPSQAANEIIAENFWNGPLSVVRPQNLKTLLESTTVASVAKAKTAWKAIDVCCGSGESNGKMTFAIGDYNLCSDRFDGIHPSQAANERIAENFWNGPLCGVRPQNLKTLLESTTIGCAAKAKTVSVSV